MNDDIFSRLKEERQRHRLTISDLAAHADNSESAVKRWEKDTPIPGDKLAMLADIGFDTQYILMGVRLPGADSIAEDRAVYQMAPEDRAIYILEMVADIQTELGIDLDKQQTQVLMKYAFKHCPSKASLREFVKAAYGVAGKHLPF